MKIGRVSATVVSTVNVPVYDHRRLLLCDLEDERQRPTGDYLIAIDTVDAGAGERVLILDEGNSARQVIDWVDAPVRAVIVGVIDEISAPGA